MSQVRLYTDALNGQGARTLYERLGFIEAKQHLLYRKPMALDGVSTRPSCHRAERQHADGGYGVGA